MRPHNWKQVLKDFDNLFSKAIGKPYQTQLLLAKPEADSPQISLSFADEVAIYEFCPKTQKRPTLAGRSERRSVYELTVTRKNGKTSYRLRIWKLAVTVEFPPPGL